MNRILCALLEGEAHGKGGATSPQRNTRVGRKWVESNPRTKVTLFHFLEQFITKMLDKALARSRERQRYLRFQIARSMRGRVRMQDVRRHEHIESLNHECPEPKLATALVLAPV